MATSSDAKMQVLVNTGPGKGRPGWVSNPPPFDDPINVKFDGDNTMHVNAVKHGNKVKKEEQYTITDPTVHILDQEETQKFQRDYDHLTLQEQKDIIRDVAGWNQ